VLPSVVPVPLRERGAGRGTLPAVAVERDPDRAYTIRRLTRLGMSVEAATRAVDTDRVTLSLLDHLLGGARDLTRAEAAAQAGVPEALAAAVERISGIPDGSRYADAEVRHLALLGRLTRLLPEDVLVEQLRGDVPVLRTMALRTLDTADHVYLRAVRERSEDPVDQAIQLARVGGPLLDVSTELIGQSFRRIVLLLLTSDLVAEALRGGSETVEVAVGFVDVVGYTSLSARIDPTGLGEVLTGFERACQAMAERRPAVQLVKFLGDAAMYASLSPVELALGLHELVQPRPDPAGAEDAPIRGGMAAGPTLFRGGDYFGPPVNEAARLTDLARRSTVLVADHLAPALEATFRLRHLRPTRLPGIGVRRPYALRSLRDEDG
jgi:adenylate cyclase